jgi:RNA polymerase sigma factor (sigma-70 family)
MARTPLSEVVRQIQRIVGSPGTGGLSDAQLLERWLAQRDEAAFEVLVWRYGPMVWGVCRRQLARTHDAEDAFQATFVILVRKAASIDKRESVGSWLHKVASRVALEARLRAARQASREQPDSGLLEAEEKPEVLWQDVRPVLDEEVNALPEKYRLPFILCYLEGKTTEAAAAQLRCPRGTVLTRLAWARQHLRQRLGRRGVTLSAVALAQLVAPSPLPAALVQAALRMATSSGIGISSSPVVALAERVLVGMTLKGKLGLVLILALGLFVAGAGILLHRESTSRQPEPPGELPNPLGAKPLQIDSEGEPLPPGAVARLGAISLRHGGVSCLASSSDGTVLASGGSDETIRLWEVSSGKLLRTLHGHTNHLLCLAFAPDGKTLVSSGKDLTLRFWETATGKELRQTYLNTMVVSIALSPDGQTVAGGTWRDTIHLWETATGKELRHWQGHKGWIESVTFSPDGKTLASSGSKEGRICLWDVKTGKEVRQLGDPHPGVGVVRFAPDGKSLASAGLWGTVRLCDPATGKEFQQFVVGKEFIKKLVFAPNGKTLYVGSFDGTVRAWDLARGKELRRIGKHPDKVLDLTLAADGTTVASVGQDNLIRLWHSATGKVLHRSEGHEHRVLSVWLSADGRTVSSASQDGTLRVWETATGKELHRLGPSSSEWVKAAGISPDGRYVVFAEALGKTIHLRETATGKELWRISRPKLTYYLSCLAFSADGKLLALGHGDPRGGKAHTICLWDTATGKEVRHLDSAGYWVSCLAFSPDGKHLAAVDWGLTRHTRPTVRLWEVSTGKEVRQFPMRGLGGVALAFSPDGKTLAGWNGTDYGKSADNPICLWEVATGKERARLAGHLASQISALVFSRDGKLLASGGDDQTIRIWDVSSGKERHSLVGHRGSIMSLAFSANNRLLVSGGEDTTLLVWDLSKLAKNGAGPAP